MIERFKTVLKKINLLFEIYFKKPDNSIQMDSFTNHKYPENDFQKQQQSQISMEQDVNLVQLREREAALRRLEDDIVDVNMIFKDLAVMVHDQGEIIDSIESNVEKVQVRVGEANQHLESAKKSQVSFLLRLNITIKYYD